MHAWGTQVIVAAREVGFSGLSGKRGLDLTNEVNETATVNLDDGLSSAPLVGCGYFNGKLVQCTEA